MVVKEAIEKPGLILDGCHGDEEKQVFEELCQIIEEAIALYRKDGKSLPLAISDHDFVNRLKNIA
ncbi:MAG: hypothetical protein KF908_06770 [Nitrosomonas sp.]|nr:hypothetical protein [Nitrosomonas sp.]MCW5608805.1 hypothetical protein [Nitrosomonas sp.]